MKRKRRAPGSGLRTGIRIFWAAAAVLMMAGPAYAHGDMAGPAELGPPMVVSGTLAVISYWIVMLWPKRPDDDDDQDRGKRRDDDRRWGGGGRPKNQPTNGNSIRLKVLKVKTEDRVSVLTEGPDESEEIDHDEERYAIHSFGSNLYRGHHSSSVRSRRGW